MEDYKQRVIEELKSLEEKKIKLEDFIWDKCPEDYFSKRYKAQFLEQGDENQALLISQLRIMCDYIHILKKRIELF